MRHIRRTILAVALALMSVAAMAQENMAVGQFFGKKWDTPVDEVYMVGQEMSVYRSIVVKESPKMVEAIRQAALKDGMNATDQKSIKRDGVVTACYYQIAPAEGQTDNRFVLFKQLSDNSAMLIYMEGATTLNDIVNIKLNKKKK